MAAARAAGFKVRAATSSSAVLALAAPSTADCVTVLAAPDGVEAVRVSGGKVTALRHVPLPEGGDPASALAGAVRLAVGSLGAGQPQTALLWNDSGLGDGALAAACGDLGIEAAPESELSPAAALAAAGLDAAALPFDFLHSRLAVRDGRPYGRTAAWAAFLLLVLLVAGGTTIADRRARTGEIEAMRARLSEMAPSVAAARSVVDSVTLARGWYDRRPAFLDCLVALTAAFPDDGRVWATSLALREDQRGVLSGKATGKQLVLDLLDALRQSGGFAEVRLLYVRETRGAAGEDTFAIAFTRAEAS